MSAGPAAVGRRGRRPDPPRVRRPHDRARRRRSRDADPDAARPREPTPRRSPRRASRTVFGHELVGELPAFVHRPYLVVTMADLWPRFEDRSPGRTSPGVHLVDTLELAELVELDDEAAARARRSSGLGGGQALDVAKFLAWTRAAAALPGPDGDDGQRAVRPPLRAARRRPRPLPRLGGPGGRLHRLRGHRARRRRTSTGPASATSSATTPRTATGSWPTGWAGPSARWPYDQRLVDDAATVMAVRRRRARRDPRRDRGGDPGPGERPSLGRDDVPRLRLEPAPHRGRGALPLLQPRADHRPPLHPRPAGRARDRRRIGRCRATSPSGWPRRSPAPASTSGPRRWA